MQATDNEMLKSAFPPSSYEEWRAAAEALLKGAPFEKVMLTSTPEGIVTQPIYRRQDVEGLSGAETMPGMGDFARGSRPEGYVETPWDVAQELDEADPKAFNKMLLDDLMRGQTALNALLDDGSGKGLRLGTVSDVAQALDGVYADAIPLHFQCGLSGLTVEATLLAWLRQKSMKPRDISGSLNMDPIGALAAAGELPVALDQLLDELACLVKWNAAEMPRFRAVGISGIPYHNAGASAVEEGAAQLATGLHYLRQLGERGCSIEEAATQMRFTVPIGGDFFMEVAKFRALRQLWSRIVRALGGSDEAAAMQTHGRTGLFNKTRRDPYVNMLRVTTEALSAVIGGVDSLAVGTFDETLRPPSPFARRIARNTQIVLREECDLLAVIDPAGGSWYIESLADELARKIWEAFQKIEAEGGILESLRSGSIQKAIAPKLAQRRRALGQRRTSLVGTNKYPNLEEKPLTGQEAAPVAPPEPVGEAESSLPAVSLTEENVLGQLVDAAVAGASVVALQAAVRSAAAPGERCERLPVARLSEDYEALRDAAEAEKARSGRGPAIFLTNLGPLRRHKARMDFTRSFFEAGGFEIIASAGIEDAESAAKAVAESGAAITVVCGHDEDYASRLVDTLKAIRSRNPKAKIVLAGYPGESEAAYREAGLDDYIFVKSDNYAVNRAYLEELGVVK